VEVCETGSLLDQQFSDAEQLTNELKRLLVRYEGALEQEGIRHEVETLERWMESYRRGLSAARKISEKGTSWLTDLRERLKLAAEELQRLEGEGGNPLDKNQAVQAEEFLKASLRIDKVIPNLDSMFHCDEKTQEEVVSPVKGNA
jgi:hypothetical protein